MALEFGRERQEEKPSSPRPINQLPDTTDIQRVRTIFEKLSVPQSQEQEITTFIPEELVTKQWGLITEVIRREIQNDPSLRQALINFAAIPLSEALPKNLLEKLAHSSNVRIAKLIERFSAGLGKYSALPAIPETNIVPDIRNAPEKLSPASALDRLKRAYGDNATISAAFEKYAQQGVFDKGLTDEERSLVSKRYKYARDIKILALQAELTDTKSAAALQENKHITLPSGTGLAINDDIPENILNPENWQKRTQIKDRVYSINIQDQTYILKEQKTNRHTDTFEKGHKPGLSSAQEFEVARYLGEHALLDQNGVKLSWEKPVAHVTFPDGYQFTVFEFVNGLKNDQEIPQTLYAKIIENRAQFENEYQEICRKMKTMEPSKLKSLLKNLVTKIQKKATEQPITYEEFSRVKTYNMIEHAKIMLEETLLAHNKKSRDHLGYGFRVLTKPQLKLEIIGMDLEYTFDGDQKESKEQRANLLQYQQQKLREGLPFLMWSDIGGEVSEAQKKAYLLMNNVQ